MTIKTVQFRGKEIANSAVIVACHAVIYFGLDAKSPTDDSSWFLQSFQKGEPKYYIEHIEAGVKRAHEEGSLLVISGGRTRGDAGARSEAQSYWLVADHYGWFGKPEVRERAVTDDYAKDSFENVLFGVCRFRECIGGYPDHITLTGWGFKVERFDLHRQAILYPADKFTYVGVNNPEDLAGAMKGEEKALAAFRADPYGKISSLAQKRNDRNPFNMVVPYLVSCPEIANLLRHEGPALYEGPLPWNLREEPSNLTV